MPRLSKDQLKKLIESPIDPKVLAKLLRSTPPQKTIQHYYAARSSKEMRAAFDLIARHKPKEDEGSDVH
jgi:hypothetical protein